MSRCQSDYVFDERTGDASDGFVYGSDPDGGKNASARAGGQGNFGGLASMLKVPEGVAAEDAVWAWLWTLSTRCFTKAQWRAGETVAVVGLGTLGMGCVALGRALGAARVVGVANSPLRAAMATQQGADATFLSSDPDLQVLILPVQVCHHTKLHCALLCVYC
jgi:threonine dehydrogenase-like Zn-dependent dehydrogenase